jgi:pyruvate/2-oxoglutarate dehydrogenase complex dihydrolipoamide acyltransferase (E2) component
MDLKIPALGDAVTEVELIEWFKADGDKVMEGEVLYALGSEKSTNDVESPASGTLTILQQPGPSFPVGHLVGRIS